jgi:DNA-binding SARP family transcriptional activator
MLDLDPFDERAHELVVKGLDRSGRHGEARNAVRRYEAAMEELGLPARDLASEGASG